MPWMPPVEDHYFPGLTEQNRVEWTLALFGPLQSPDEPVRTAIASRHEEDRRCSARRPHHSTRTLVLPTVGHHRRLANTISSVRIGRGYGAQLSPTPKKIGLKPGEQSFSGINEVKSLRNEMNGK
jgi:hypothetical protein